ncbi:MAG: hypothetical protein LBP68_04130, partial [Acidobacteriota bacterium]|nr:hypothetical protein [Acidobacteriota bacterium]
MKYAKRIGLGLTLVGLALMLALAVGTAFPTEDVAVLLEKAIYTEETLGDLDAAIGIYRQIVDG